MKHKVVLYQEIYSEHEVEADTLEEAEQLVIEGEAPEPVDVTVKFGEISSSKTIESV
tara:strand:+ start:82 stop:252 length:171 start_codon:yes stop_codon:yes gene_type:complete